jgi:RimJ/RimL family protein N-acetyltransferase
MDISSFYRSLPIEDPHIHLRKLKSSDFDDLFHVASDPEIWIQHPDRLRYTSEGFARFFEAALLPDCLSLLILDKVSGSVMGSSRYYQIDEEMRTVHIGYTFLGRSYWGGIWNARLKHAMLEHAFGLVSTVYFEAAADNFRSVSALLKMGCKEQLHETPSKKRFAISSDDWPAIKIGLQKAGQIGLGKCL